MTAPKRHGVVYKFGAAMAAGVMVLLMLIVVLALIWVAQELLWAVVL